MRTEQRVQELGDKKDKLEKLIANILNDDNENYSKLKQIVKENVKDVLSDNKKLISISFAALIQTIKADPEMVKVIHNIPNANDGEQYRDNNNIPLVYFLSQFQPLILDLFATYHVSEPVLFGIVYTLIISGSKPAGGVLFGIAFWSIARGVKRSAVKDYMIISAYGIMLLFTSSQTTVLITAPYPPFGLATISFMGLSSYLILVGIYSSAVSVAQDLELRKLIRKYTRRESKVLDSIVSAEMEKEIQNRVMKIVDEQSFKMKEETGVQSSLNEEDIKEYLVKVLSETKRES